MEFTGRKMTFLNCELRHEQIVCESLTNDTLCFPIECPPLIVLIKLMNVYLVISQRHSLQIKCVKVYYFKCHPSQEIQKLVSIYRVLFLILRIMIHCLVSLSNQEERL